MPPEESLQTTAAIEVEDDISGKFYFLFFLLSSTNYEVVYHFKLRSSQAACRQYVCVIDLLSQSSLGYRIEFLHIRLYEGTDALSSQFSFAIFIIPRNFQSNTLHSEKKNI
mgnify:CR=1 FL=1